jgi:hypothetical protein
MVDSIETKAFGCRFRSRLEARWAVFLTALRIEWDYEREGFVIGGTPYLPDFWLPSTDPETRALGWGHWLEIKPTWPLIREQVALYAGVAKETGHRLLAACNGPWNAKFYIFDHHHNGDPLDVPLCSEAGLLENRHTGEILLFDSLTGRRMPSRFEHGESP